MKKGINMIMAEPKDGRIDVITVRLLDFFSSLVSHEMELGLKSDAANST